MSRVEMTLDHVRGVAIGAALLALMLCAMLWPGCVDGRPEGSATPSAQDWSERVPPGATLTGAFGTGDGALLHVFREVRGTWSRLEEKETNVRDGHYAVRGLAPGRYRLSLSDSGEPPLADIEIGTADVTRDL